MNLRGRNEQYTASNMRFGAMAGVTPQKVQCEIER